ncbi:RsmB/NOP family class I SAM-dependent RNA methyltransferase [Brevundimonas aveniformis]|uniref:RsmB/NOP family class I SAM-dependent RNA methyltransferase n=1 Tax=Brevundimonas aveniformis TaxID=370977 RepID=UPI0004138F72|nr:RsmB/NOP family class I SAM-dependent RNA methyltransferase [Brevundimonas aveniformis]
MNANAGLPARQAALRLIEAATLRRGGLDVALNEPTLRTLSPEDRGFARALAMAVLRRLGSIDRALDSRLQRPPPEPVRRLLRIGLAQMLYLDTPDFAAVSTTVKLAERDNATRPYKALINAVLRGLARDPAAEPPPEADIPPWLFARWVAQFGQADAEHIALNARVEPATDLSLKPDTDPVVLIDALPAEALPGGSLRTHRGGDVAGWPGFTDGGWWVQDAAAAVPARLLAARPGEAALDLCAAPGGKTLQLAATGATVTALDRSEPRLRRLRANLERIGLKAEVVVADAETWADHRQFDAVLLDAPCTATGTLRRNPEALYALGPAEIAKLADVQHRLLDAAAARVKPGGRLVYCVCSLEREEGETQILAFLKRHPDFRVGSADPQAAGAPVEALGKEGWLRLLPSQWPELGGLDGFFAARLERTA